MVFGGGVILAGQPQPEDLPQLARQGIRSVINLSRDSQRSDQEANNADAAGLDYLHLPLPAYELEPHRMINQGWNRDAAEAELRDAGYTEESMEVFTFCADDYFERAGEPATVA